MKPSHAAPQDEPTPHHAEAVLASAPSWATPEGRRALSEARRQLIDRYEAMRAWQDPSPATEDQLQEWQRRIWGHLEGLAEARRMIGAMIQKTGYKNTPRDDSDEVLQWLDSDRGRTLRVGYEHGYWWSAYPGETAVQQANTFRELIERRMAKSPNEKGQR